MIVKHTTAAILVKSNQPLVIGEIQLPEELFPGQVLVEIFSSGLCGAQINEIDAIKGPDEFLPHLLGHEGFGRVLQVGPGVSTVKAGDQVVMHWRPGTGIQSIPPKYIWQGQTLNAGWITTMNKQVRATILTERVVLAQGCSRILTIRVYAKTHNFVYPCIF